MTVFIITDWKAGTLSRYETSGKELNRTHSGTLDKSYNFSGADVDLMRYSPPAALASPKKVRRE
jgi:hypothetical protein